MRYVSRETYKEGWQHETSSLYGDVFYFEEMRRKEREITNQEEIIRIMESVQIINLGLVDELPYIVPLNFVFKENQGKLSLYFHCAKEGRKISLIQKNSGCSFTLYNDLGVKIKKRGEQTTNYYECVMGNGEIREITDEQKKQEIINLLLSKYGYKGDMIIAKEIRDKTYIGEISITNISGKANKEEIL